MVWSLGVGSGPHCSLWLETSSWFEEEGRSGSILVSADHLLGVQGQLVEPSCNSGSSVGAGGRL